jgi:hypothetical protein
LLAGEVEEVEARRGVCSEVTGVAYSLGHVAGAGVGRDRMSARAALRMGRGTRLQKCEVEEVEVHERFLLPGAMAQDAARCVTAGV